MFNNLYLQTGRFFFKIYFGCIKSIFVSLAELVFLNPLQIIKNSINELGYFVGYKILNWILKFNS